MSGLWTGKVNQGVSSVDGHKHSCIVCWEKHLTEKRKSEWQAKQERKERDRQQREQNHQRNTLLREHGYRWRSEEQEVDYGEEEDSRFEIVWQLYDKYNRPITLDQALSEIDSIIHPQAPQGNILAVQSWAQELVQRRPLILDTETTGFGTQAEVIEMAIVDIAGHTFMRTLIKCQDRIPPQASRVHGITNDMIQPNNIPTFPQVLNWLKTHIGEDRELVIYNAEYDLMVLMNTAKRYGLTFPSYETHCLMLQYSAYVGEPGTQGPYRYQKLARACTEFGIEHVSHRALGDAQAARQVLLKLVGEQHRQYQGVTNEQE